MRETMRIEIPFPESLFYEIPNMDMSIEFRIHSPPN